MRILVTGATGFVGSAVTRALLQDGHTVLDLVRDPNRAGALENDGVTFVKGDILLSETYVPYVKNVDIVVHTAQYGTSGRLTRAKLEHIKAADKTMTEALADACTEHAKRLVYTSGCFNYGDHGDDWVDEGTLQTPSPLGEGHAELTTHLLRRHRDKGLDVVLLAPGFVYGPAGLFKTAFWDTLEKGQLRVFGKGDNYWSSVHVADLAQAYARVVTSDVSGEVINVVDDTPLKLRELVDAFTNVAGKPRVESAPPWLLGPIIGRPLVASLTNSFLITSFAISFQGRRRGKVGLLWPTIPDTSVVSKRCFCTPTFTSTTGSSPTIDSYPDTASKKSAAASC